MEVRMSADHKPSAPEAAATLEQALVTWKQLVDHNPHVPEDRDGLASAQRRLADTCTERGESGNAEAMIKAAASTYQALVQDHPDRPEYRHSLARTYMALGGLYFNNMRQADERTRLKTQDADRAMEFLRQAVAKGFQDAAALKTDPDLAPLRSRDDFRELMQELEHKTIK
jgi:hypothetical protein